MLRTKVKASSITNLTDARYFAAMGVEWLGFNLNPQNGSVISAASIREIEGWVEGVQIVAEYGREHWDKIRESVLEVIPNVIQVGENCGIQEMLELPPSVQVIREFIIDKETSAEQLIEEMENLDGHVMAFAFNFMGNSLTWDHLVKGIPFSVSTLEEITARFPVILEVDLDVPGLKACLSLSSLEGITLKGGEEEKTGFKSFEELDELFDVLMD
ncbi:MAG: hypothetical protein KDC85_05450 [Saprospiraceae bacterium]|nr:hypothetical protein [Saprospiraceae bacterium]MCB9324955.1 hypothetical protein [Lewinellaceae bacterium]